MSELSHENLGIIYWNTLYRSAPEDQLAHIDMLERQLHLQGAMATVACLSEVTTRDDGLISTLSGAGRAVLSYGSGRSYGAAVRREAFDEALAISSQDVEINPVSAVATTVRMQRGFGGVKHRALLGITVPLVGVKLGVLMTHLAYPRPSKREKQRLFDEIDTYRDATGLDELVIGGDMNTVLGDSIVDEFATRGFIKLRHSERKTTFPILKASSMGWELDHVFVTEGLADRATLEVAAPGPSNHCAMLVTIHRALSG